MLNLLRVAEQNPWWHEPGAIEQDFHVRAFEASPTKCEPQKIGAFCFDTDAVYTPRGPRQVGKTTLLKLLMRRPWRTGWRPERLCYFNRAVPPARRLGRGRKTRTARLPARGRIPVQRPLAKPRGGGPRGERPPRPRAD